MLHSLTFKFKLETFLKAHAQLNSHSSKVKKLQNPPSSHSLKRFFNVISIFRYADRAKRIVNHAVVNEDPNAR